MVEVAVHHSCLLGEGPVWDTKTNTLCWVDILNGDIHELDPKTASFKTTSVNQFVGTVVLCTDGNYLAALRDGLAIINRQTGAINLLTHPEQHLPGNRFNDGKCDSQGRFWIGSMSLDEVSDSGSLYMLDAEINISQKETNITISNGMAWSLGDDVLYYIDTPTLAVVAYDINKATGAISNKRTAITIEEQEGYPDGMTIDSEGMLWIAHWGGWQVTRWDPVKGKQLFSLPLPVANVTSCTFGGEGLSDLYITTAKKDLSDDELRQQPLAGNLFVWKDCGFTGLPAFEFIV